MGGEVQEEWGLDDVGIIRCWAFILRWDAIEGFVAEESLLQRVSFTKISLDPMLAVNGWEEKRKVERRVRTRLQ